MFILKRGLATVAEKAQAKIVDVLIVGGGPAGLTLTTALKNSPITKDLKISLIEGFNLSGVKEFYDKTPEGFTNRISSLTPQSIDYLKSIGSWDFIKTDRIQPYDSITVTEGLSDARLNFDSIELATMCENVNLQSSLYQRIKELESNELDIIDNTRVENITKDPKDQWPIVHLSNGEQIKTRLLVGADGFNSPVRKFAGIESRGWFYERFGVVATMQLDDIPFKSVGWQRFLPNGPIALLPLPGDHATLVWSQSIELSKLLIEIDENLFKELVNAAFILDDVDMNYYYSCIKKGETEDLIDDIKWRIQLKHNKLSDEQIEDDFPLPVISIDHNSRARFPLRLSHADTYVSERVALVGDAAHTTHPLAGQGLNMGQGDVQSLVHAIEKGMQRGLDIGNVLVLEPYWAERFPENNLLLGVVDKLHKLYSCTAEPVVALRSFGLNVVNELSMLKDLMIKQVSGK